MVHTHILFATQQKFSDQILLGNLQLHKRIKLQWKAYNWRKFQIKKTPRVREVIQIERFSVTRTFE